ncbi:MAG: fibronectin type III domain-containing protein [Burkholderiales bacterium]|nr:fibronectin type III domain-containing protein [Burkholderiales bacterium]
MTTCVLVAAMLTACGGGITDGSATASAASLIADGGGTATSQPTPNPAPSDPGISAPAPTSAPASHGSGTSAPSPALGSISLSWTAPSTNADGSPVSDLAGYRVYYGTMQGLYSDNVTINNPATLSTTISNLPASTYYVVVRAFNQVNAESQASVEVSKTIM